MSTAGSLLELGREMLAAGRPGEAGGVLVAALTSATEGGASQRELGAVLRELVPLQVDGTAGDAVRRSTGLREALRQAMGRLDGAADLALCLAGIGMEAETCGDLTLSLKVAHELRTLLGEVAGDDEPMVLLALAIVRRSCGLPASEADAAARLLLRRRLCGDTPSRRLLVRSLIVASTDATRGAFRAAALNHASAAVGHARALRAGFRAVLLADALENAHRVLDGLGRHGEAMMAALEAVEVSASWNVSLRGVG